MGMTNAEKYASALTDVVMMATDLAGREATGTTGDRWADEIGEAEKRLAAAAQGMAEDAARKVVAEMREPQATIDPFYTIGPGYTAPTTT